MKSSQIVDEYVGCPDVKRWNPDAIDSAELAGIPAKILIDPTLTANQTSQYSFNHKHIGPRTEGLKHTLAASITAN